MRTIRLTETAEDDLKHIWHYTVSQWGREQAGRYIAYRLSGDYIDVPGISHVRMDAKRHLSKS